jgi:hypothetical protein
MRHPLTRHGIRANEEAASFPGGFPWCCEDLQQPSIRAVLNGTSHPIPCSPTGDPWKPQTKRTHLTLGIPEGKPGTVTVAWTRFRRFLRPFPRTTVLTPLNSLWCSSLSARLSHSLPDPGERPLR